PRSLLSVPRERALRTQARRTAAAGRVLPRARRGFRHTCPAARVRRSLDVSGVGGGGRSRAVGRRPAGPDAAAGVWLAPATRRRICVPVRRTAAGGRRAGAEQPVPGLRDGERGGALLQLVHATQS